MEEAFGGNHGGGPDRKCVWAGLWCIVVFASVCVEAYGWVTAGEAGARRCVLLARKERRQLGAVQLVMVVRVSAGLDAGVDWVRGCVGAREVGRRRAVSTFIARCTAERRRRRSDGSVQV